MLSIGPEHLCDRCEYRCLGCPESQWNTAPRHCIRAGATLSVSVHGEIAEVLARPKFARVIFDDRHLEILELLTAAALWVEPKAKVQEFRDSNDNRYLELALTAGATATVSGDEDLLVLHRWRGV